MNGKKPDRRPVVGKSLAEMAYSSRLFLRLGVLICSINTPAILSAQNQQGLTIQLPVLGVSVDANGLLTANAFPDPAGQLMALKRLAARNQLPGHVRQPAKMRKVSLRRLERAIAARLKAGDPISDELKFLAGLQRVEYAFVFPDQKDIVIAGPAEGWLQNLSGRTVGIHSGKPVVLLEDLIAALRIFGPQRNLNTWVGCSINPTPEGLAKLAEFNRNFPDRIPNSARAAALVRLRDGMATKLGLANIEVYGIQRKTNLAQVLVESDYRMKLIAVGLEPVPIKMTTFIGALKERPVMCSAGG